MRKEKYLYAFSPEKNRLLIEERQISFEEIIASIYSGGLLDIIENPNKAKYKNQQMYVVHVNNYVYLVPFIQEGKDCIFLKTIIPSRKAKRLNLQEVTEYETEKET